MTTKKSTATIVAAKVRVSINIKELVLEQLYRKMPDACDITNIRVDIDDTIDALENNLEDFRVTMDIEVAE